MYAAVFVRAVDDVFRHFYVELNQTPFILQFPTHLLTNLLISSTSLFVIQVIIDFVVWPVSRLWLLLHGTWSYLRICWGTVLPYTRFWIIQLTLLILKSLNLKYRLYWTETKSSISFSHFLCKKVGYFEIAYIEISLILKSTLGPLRW
jgi:hypothetical protein